MQKPQNKNLSMQLLSEEEIFNLVLPSDHPFRKLNNLLDWEEIVKPLRHLYSNKGRNGIDIIRGFKALIVQHWEDYSDREMEKALRENFAVKWFCGFTLSESTPDHSYFGSLRSRIGAENLARTFNKVNTILNNYGLFGNIFAVIDASAIISKVALWQERDRAISDGKKKLDNSVVSDYSKDKEAKWGAKGKNKIWFGYKKHNSIDMRYGLIRKVAVTPANVPDYKMAGDISEGNMAYFTDKGYDYKDVGNTLKMKGSYHCNIRKNNNKEKNFDLDRWRSKTRMPFEGAFAHKNRYTRFKGRVKVFMSCVLESIVHNLKKAVIYGPDLAI